jgi:predicted amidohydrolase YtcJ
MIKKVSGAIGVLILIYLAANFISWPENQTTLPANNSDSNDTQPPVQAADWILTGGKFFTVNESQPWAEAVAIKDGRFIYVGNDAGVTSFIGPATQQTALADRLVIPGIVDAHTHPGFHNVERHITLPGTNPEDFLKAVQDYSESHPGDDMIRLCCWANNWYVSGKEGPHKEVLDAVVPDRPVWINAESWHSAWLNSKALEKIGVNKDTPDPGAGVAVYARDEAGELTGWVKEGAAWQHFAEQFPVDVEVHHKGMVAFLDTLSKHGVTTVYDGGNFGYGDQVYSFLSQLDKSGQLPLRYEGTYQILVPERRFGAVAEMRRLQRQYGGPRLQFRTIKLFMDGISENRTSAILEAYSDNPDYVGRTMLSVEQLRDFLIELHEEKFDLHIHIIGDMAARRVLDGVEAARNEVGDSFYPQVTVAHLELTDPADFARFAELGVIANFTPWWHGVDIGSVVTPALGPERMSRTYTAKPLFDAGALVTFSSDGWGALDMLTPFLGMQVGHNRQYPKEWLADGDDGSAFRLPESEKLDLELMVRGYTLNGAHQFRLEDDIGSIEVGKSADLVVLDDNLFTMDRDAIHTIKPSAVMMEGELIQGQLPN